MPKGGKGKGRNKGKGGKGKGGGKGKQNKGQQCQQQKGSGGNSPKKHNNQPRPPNANQQKRLDKLMLKEIDEMYSEHTQKHDSLRTFFGIFTRHNTIHLSIIHIHPFVHHRHTSICPSSTSIHLSIIHMSNISSDHIYLHFQHSVRSALQTS